MTRSPGAARSLHVPVNRVSHHGAGRDAEDEIFGAAAVAVRALAVLAAAGPPVLAMGERGQAIDAGLGDQHDAAAVAAVAAVGPAAGDVFLTAEAYASITAAASFDFDSDAIDEHGGGGGRGAGSRELDKAKPQAEAARMSNVIAALEMVK